MMTTIVAIEKLHDLNEKIKLTKSMFEGLYKADASMAGFQPGEEVRAIDLLYGVMLPSGAECCIALADHIAGSEQNTLPTNKHPGGITFYSTMYERLGNQNIIDGKILGGKTGYTDEAGLCLASLAKVGKQEYILITAGAKGDHQSEQYNIIDALAVYNSIRK